MIFALSGLAVTIILLGMVIGGAIAISRGLRGYPSLADPCCMKCGYDLRGFVGAKPTLCSECGADLTAPRSIRLAAYQRDKRSVWVGVALLLVALLGFPVLRMAAIFTSQRLGGGAANSPQVIATQTNAQIIANLPATAGTPWAWQELDRRRISGAMTPAEVTAAIDQFIKFRGASGSKQNTGPLVWEEQFLQNADNAHLISPQQFDRLADAFFGSKPTVTIASTLSTGPTPIKIQYGGSWDLLGRIPIFALRSVKLEDGTPVQCVAENYSYDHSHNAQHLSRNGPFPLDADLTVTATPGSHHLIFIVDTGVIDQQTRQLISSQEPGQSEQWPSNVTVKQRQVDLPITLVGAGLPTLDLVNSTAGHQWPPFKLRSITAIPGLDRGTLIKVLLDSLPSDVDCDYDVWLTIAGTKYNLGMEGRRGSEGSSNDHVTTVHPALTPDMVTASISMIPNTDRAAKTPGVSRIWGLPVEFKDASLRRLDMPAPTQTQSP